MMEEDKKIHWLSRRLKELRKTKAELGAILGVDRARISEIETGRWHFQTQHIKKAAEYLEFDRMAFLDFVSGEISEDELWNAKPPVKITEDDLKLLNAVKSIATDTTRKETPDAAPNTYQQAAIPPKDNGR